MRTKIDKNCDYHIHLIRHFYLKIKRKVFNPSEFWIFVRSGNTFKERQWMSLQLWIASNWAHLFQMELDQVDEILTAYRLSSKFHRKRKLLCFLKRFKIECHVFCMIFVHRISSWLVSTHVILLSISTRKISHTY